MPSVQSLESNLLLLLLTLLRKGKFSWFKLEIHPLKRTYKNSVTWTHLTARANSSSVRSLSRPSAQNNAGGSSHAKNAVDLRPLLAMSTSVLILLVPAQRLTQRTLSVLRHVIQPHALSS